jgi:hypothetical protein
MSGRTQPPPNPPTEPPLRRLRDHFGDRSDVANRAGEIIRAVMPPGPLEPGASARVLSAVRGTPGRGAWWLQRVMLATATLVVVGATAAGAAAALDLIELSWPPGRPQVTPLPPPAAPVRRPAARPAIAPAAPAAPVVVARHARAAARAPEEPQPAQLEEARLLIDPHAREHRPQLPQEFARQHAGQEFAWKVNICVSPEGTVASARLAALVHPLLDHRLLSAIAGWQYQPARLNDRAVRSCTDVVYRLTVEPATDR